jgi:hypothetical protein
VRGGVKRKCEGIMGGAYVKGDEEKGKTLQYETGLAKDRKVFWISLMELGA